MLRSFAALLILSAGASTFASTTAAPTATTGTTPAATTATGASTTLSYKEAKATCLKEKPELKGKDLRTCVTQKQIAAKGGTGAVTK